MKKKAKIIAIVVISIIAIVAIVSLLANYGTKEGVIKSFNKNENIEEVNMEDYTEVAEFDEESVKNFLICDDLNKYISDRVSSTYVFLSNGKFAWSRGDEKILYASRENDKFLSYIGNWKIEDNRLILNIQEEKIAVFKDKPYITTDYQEETNQVNKKVEYIIDGIKYDTNTKKKMLALQNGSINLYECYEEKSKENNYSTTLKDMANNNKNIAKVENTDKTFSSDDLKILGISLGMKKTEVIKILGDNYKQTEEYMTYVDVYNYIVTYPDLGLEIKYEYSNWESEYVKDYVIEITLIDNKSKAMRGLTVFSSKEDLLNAFNKENILSDTKDEYWNFGHYNIERKGEIVTVGYEGSDSYFADEYFGKISFLLENDKIKLICIHQGGQ